MNKKTEMPTGFTLECTWLDEGPLVYYWKHYKGEYSGHFVNDKDARDDAWLAFPLIQRKMNNESLIKQYQLRNKK